MLRRISAVPMIRADSPVELLDPQVVDKVARVVPDLKAFPEMGSGCCSELMQMRSQKNKKFQAKRNR